jgi:hypothetical protein
MNHRDPEYGLLQTCLQQIERQLGWGPAEQWHNTAFNDLSEDIHQQVGILLSPTTLKRVWGRVRYQSQPSITTLNALAQFAGFENWRAFKNEYQVQQKRESIQPKRKSLSSRGIVLTSAAFMTIVFISIYSMIGSEPATREPNDYSQAVFSSKPVTEGLPNSVIFDFDLTGITADSFSIQQYWDPTKTIKIKPGQQQATGLYYWPGYFRAKLRADGAIVKEHDLFIKSNGWIATLDYEPVPKYIEGVQASAPYLSLPESVLEEIQNRTEMLTSSYHFVDELGAISADGFSLETRIRNIYHDKWAVCQKTRIILLGTKGAMVIPFSIPGCVSDIGLMLNDIYLDGKQHDLSAFGIDLSEFRDIRIEVQDMQARISVDEQAVYEGSYHEQVGRLVGIRYRFLGAGEVAHLHIMDDKGKVISLKE